MKSKIAIKLTLYFSIALIAFAVIVSIVFISVFSSHTTDVYKQDMERTAKKIAATVSDFYSGEPIILEHGNMHGQGGGFGAYLKYLNDVSVSNIWIVDKGSKAITCNMNILYDELPQEARDILNDCFNGQTIASENFSSVLDDKTITVGTPIISSEDNKVVGVVLLHTSVSGIFDSVASVFSILGIVIIAALIAVVILAVMLSARFTKPLLQINRTAQILAEGDYSAKTGIEDRDEIGQLAKTVDTLSVRLFDASQESQKLEKLRQEFVSNISHELRTPVTVIRGSLEAIKDGVAEGERKEEYIGAAHSESVHLERLVNDLLELSRLQNIDFDIEMSPINVCDITLDVVRSMSQLAEKKHIALELKNDVQHFEFVGDYGRLRQMLMILVDNAVKFSPEMSSVIIRIESSRLSVEDHGCGIAADELPYIFDRFRKAQENNRNGSGLGLAIAKQIAIRHGIKINVFSEPGIKTVFSLDFLDGV